MNSFIRFDFDHDINIYPIFDPHFGSVNHCEKEFREYLKIIMNDPVGYAVLGGDLVNNNIGGMIPWEDTISPHLQIEGIVDLLLPLAKDNRLLCSLRGNHEFRTMKNSFIDSSAIIASKLDISDRYRPDIAFLSIGIGTRKHGSNQKARAATRYVIGVSHGFGGGMKPGATVNRAVDFWETYEGINVGITGHTHKPVMLPKRKIVIDRVTGKQVARDDLVCVASSWMDGSEGYPIQKGLPAASTCIVQRITLYEPMVTDGHGMVDAMFRSIRRAAWEPVV
jgi:hypothetical protein